MPDPVTPREITQIYKSLLILIKKFNFKSEKAVDEVNKALRQVSVDLSKVKSLIEVLKKKKDLRGKDGKDGKDGKSIKGEKGDKGDKGDSEKGDKGDKGEKGDTGEVKDGKDGKDGLDGSPDTPDEVKGKLEILEEEDRLKIEAIHNLREELDDLKNRPVGRGGGVTDMRIRQAFKYIAHTETPTGAIDGANVTYTVKNDIWWIAGFMLNGEQIGELPNFTYTGRTITFSTALPSDYSSSDFECKYIG